MRPNGGRRVSTPQQLDSVFGPTNMADKLASQMVGQLVLAGIRLGINM
jgi:hypothetical protein